MEKEEEAFLHTE